MKVKDTYLSAIIEGDIGMHASKGFLGGDILGPFIVLGEGNLVPDRDGDGKWDPGYSSGSYTHCFMITQRPDPEAEVEAVRVDKKTGRVVYRVLDKKRAGTKIHSTWPTVTEEPVKWEETHMEMWRIREVSRRYWKAMQVPEIVQRMITWTRSQKGQPYDWLNLITFGLVSLPNGRHCSRFIFDAAKIASVYEQGDRRPFILSPEGEFDGLPTPNDLVNSQQMIRLRYKGMKA